MRGIQVSKYVEVKHSLSFPSPTSTPPSPTPSIFSQDPRTNISSKGPSALKVTTLPTPSLSPSQYLIAIHATAANFFDLLQIQGKYQNQPPLPWISGSEFAGTITALPTSPTTPPKFKLGDRVFGAAQGGFATHVLAPEASLRPVPRGWSFDDAAGLFVTAPTGYGALVTRANVQRGEWVLVHAAAGGVGLAAVQVAKARGARVIATAGTAAKLEVAKRFGADYGVDYGDAAWMEEVKRITGGKGVDVVFDPVGMVDASMKCTAWNGRIVVVGFAAGKIERVAMNRVLLKNVSLVGLHWGRYVREEPEMVEEVWRGIMGMIERGEFRGTVFRDHEFVGLEMVPAALEALGSRGTWGKVVIKVPQEEEGAKL